MNQIAKLFNRDKSVSSKYLKDIFKTKELNKSTTVAKFATVQHEGNRNIMRNIEHYNLDAILSVGYRVNSKQGTQFRIWATNILIFCLDFSVHYNSQKVARLRVLTFWER